MNGDSAGAGWEETAVADALTATAVGVATGGNISVPAICETSGSETLVGCEPSMTLSLCV